MNIVQQGGFVRELPHRRSADFQAELHVEPIDRAVPPCRATWAIPDVVVYFDKVAWFESRLGIRVHQELKGGQLARVLVSTLKPIYKVALLPATYTGYIEQYGLVQVTSSPRSVQILPSLECIQIQNFQDIFLGI